MRAPIRIALAAAVAIGVVTLPVTSAQAKPRTASFTAEVWADNWFALYVNGRKVGEDSIPITTERSFNAETITFTATYPLVIGIMGRDFTENASGLEYIGTPKQQIGDAGLIAQIRDNTSGKIIAATGASWKVLVLNTAPLNPSCVTSSNPLVDCTSSTIATPRKWSTTNWSPKGWSPATVYTPQEVGVKEGYNTISWDPSAKLVWGPDLELDNAVLLRTTAK